MSKRAFGALNRNLSTKIRLTCSDERMCVHHILLEVLFLWKQDSSPLMLLRSWCKCIFAYLIIRMSVTRSDQKYAAAFLTKFNIR